MSEMKSILSGVDKAPTRKSAAKFGVKKVRVVDLGDKGSFKITKAGALKAKARAAGESTKEFAASHDKGKSMTANQSRAALGLMAMGGR